MTKKANYLSLAVFGALSSLMLPLAFAGAAVNLVPNPSLETADSTGTNPQSWARGRWGTNTTQFLYPVAGFAGARAAQVTINQYTSGDAKWYFREEVAVTPGKTYDFSNNFMSSIPSWVTIQYRMTDGTLRWVDIAQLGGSSDWQQVKRRFTVPSGVASLTIFHLIKQTGSLTVDNYSLTEQTTTTPPPPPNQFTNGMVSINFDDGWRTTFQNALPILQNAGLKASWYIISGRFSFPSYIDQNQTLQLQSAGQEVGAHTRRHMDLTTLSESQMRSEIIGSKDDLHGIGISSVTTFAYPFGSYNSKTDQIVREAFIGARTSDGGFNLKTGDQFLLKRQGVVVNTTFNQIKGWIDQAVAQKQWLVLVFHRVDDSATQYSTTPAIFLEVVNYLKSQSVPVITMDQGVKIMNQ